MISRRKTISVLAAAVVAGVFTSGLICLSYALVLHGVLSKPAFGLLGREAGQNQPAVPAASSPNTPAADPSGSMIRARLVGTVRAITGNAITLATDSGVELKVIVEEFTRMLRAAPGQKDLKDATPISLQSLAVGDRMLVRGSLAEDGKAIVASSVMVMKQTDIAKRQAQEYQEWQQHGVGGLVSAVDPSGGSVTISTLTATGKKNIQIRVLQNTIVRRYAPDSVRFDEAKPGTLEQIRPGDQLRARGTYNSDDTELVAEEIVGTFRSLAGAISSVDAGNRTITLKDLATNKAATVKITVDSQLKKLPPGIAQRLALRLKGELPDARPGASIEEGRPPVPARIEGNFPVGRPGGWRSAGTGPPDVQEILNRIPPITLAQLQKGDAVMIVATEGTASSGSTAITLLTGVEPILTASPGGDGAVMLLTPWSLGGSTA